MKVLIFLFFFFSLFNYILASQAPLFDYLYKYYVTGQIPVKYYQNNNLQKNSLNVVECSLDQDGNYYFYLSNKKKVIVYFVLGPVANRLRSLPIVQQEALNSSDRAYIQARYSYEKIMAQMTSSAFADDSLISAPQVNFDNSDLITQNSNSQSSQGQTILVPARYYVLKLYNNNSTRYDLNDMNSVGYGQISVTDKGLFLDDQPLDIVLQLVNK